jgi:hypothetical protein
MGKANLVVLAWRIIASILCGLLDRVLFISATGHDPEKVTCDQAQRLSTGSLQCITGNGQHDGGMGAVQQEGDER